MENTTRSALLLHLPSQLKEQVRDLARENKRSMTKVIELAIEQRITSAKEHA